MTAGVALSGQSEDVHGLIFSVLSATDLPPSAAHTHTPQHTHVHKPAQHGHEVHVLRPKVRKHTSKNKILFCCALLLYFKISVLLSQTGNNETSILL